MTAQQLDLALSLETVDGHAARAFALARGCLPLLRAELLHHVDGTLKALARDVILVIERRAIFGSRAVHDLDVLVDLLGRHVAAASTDVPRWYPGDATCDPYCVVETVPGQKAHRLTPLLERVVALHRTVGTVLDIVHSERALADIRRTA